MREVVIDTETTGLDPQAGHRIVEIACLELIHHVPTGRKLHRYVNPERDVPADAMAVHGLDAEFLAEHPPFAAIAEELTEFIAGDSLVIHNAEFDLAFITRSWRGSTTARSPVRSSTRLRWRAAGSRGRPPASTRCAAGLRSI